MTQARFTEYPGDVLEILHRYPLLVWYDPTASNDFEESLLEQENVKTLRSLVASKCGTEGEVEWQDLMEWFVCAVIGLKSKVSQSDGSFWFDWDDVVVDGFGTARINLFASHSDSSPPHSQQSFSDCLASLSQLFFDMIDQLSNSNCLPTRIEHFFRRKMMISILHHLIDHLVGTGHVVPACSASMFEEIVSYIINSFFDSIPTGISVVDDFMSLPYYILQIVKTMEAVDIVENEVRLTGPLGDFPSSQFEQFVDLVNCEIVQVRKQYDPDLLEEARRVSSWKELLQKVASGEEVENDTSFLKLPFFRPTLLSLQAKFQQLTSSMDGSAGTSTSSLLSSHSTPHPSLDAHLDSSLRSLSSSSHVKQESLELLTILHSLLTSPLPSSLPTHSSTITSGRLTFLQHEPVDLDEKFTTSLFDETDNEKLTRSLVRCRSVCELVGAEKCVVDIPVFFDRLLSVLGSSDSLLRASAFHLFEGLIDVPCAIPLMPRLWDRLRNAFRDGHPEEQHAFVEISIKWISHQWKDRSLPPFPSTEFDWDGLTSADLSDKLTFIRTILLIELIRRHSIENQKRSRAVTDSILSFEERQHAVERIVTFFGYPHKLEKYSEKCVYLVSYCLLMSLRTLCHFPPTLTTILTQRPDIDVFSLLHLMDQVFLLCHTSLDPHKPHQPPLDLLFERTLRSDPLNFFFSFNEPVDYFSPSLVNTALCGFHALCRRGVHLDLMESVILKTGHNLFNTMWMFNTPLISDTFHLFHYFPPPLVIRIFLPILSLATTHSSLVDPLRAMMTTLLFATAPFGDCHSVRELFRSVGWRNDEGGTNSLESIVIPGCEVENVMKMVRFGMFDIVIRGVSESSFLEDYENGICVIGILLRSILHFAIVTIIDAK
ncbi:hypothetical protein BLNAU_15219 [Blattamonas nauphoetae]|uniref:Uncharacterized protein n=1 Tax=Blattamonas nauphoetae TaxID=2049346 RepID=A0ABQ9XG47_9EUKA|nr:hypothetical protein BLNAU_15219 [Blattamonas nauphoetae]